MSLEPQIPRNNCFGIANISLPKASLFAQCLYYFPGNIPIYQQQLVHSTKWASGPAQAEAAWCFIEDNEVGNCSIIREISGHDTSFGRYNLSNGSISNPCRYSYRLHSVINWTNQIYYLTNEPDLANSLTMDPYSCGNCWAARNRDLDSAITQYFPIPGTQFWEDADTDTNRTYLECESKTDYKRINPEALAFLFLTQWRENYNLGRGHILLPPSATQAFLAEQGYWQSFFECVHRTGVTINNINRPKISVSDLKALHFHYYTAKLYTLTDDPNNPDPQGPKIITLLDTSTRQIVGTSATEIRYGINKYRSSEWSGHGDGPLPLDVLITENGPYWDTIYDELGTVIKDGVIVDMSGLKYSGGWPSIREGLNWWNTYLCWLTRLAGTDFGLQVTGIPREYAVYGCIHEAMFRPYVVDYAPADTRNQNYLNTDSMQLSNHNAMPAVRLNGLTSEMGFMDSFTTFGVSYTHSAYGASKPFRMAPFGACYYVWSKVGLDGVTENLGTGWVTNTLNGIVGSVTVILPGGWSTVYFPIIKSTGQFTENTIFTMTWIKGGQSRQFGSMNMSHFDDTGTYDNEVLDLTQTVYSAMVYPVVVYSSGGSTLTVQISRNIAGVRAWVGRPIVRQGACSWFTTQ